VADEAIHTGTILPVTVEAPPHTETPDRIHPVHLLHISVALGTVHTLYHMSFVRKIDVIRDIIHTDPFHRFSILEERCKLLYPWLVIGCDLVASHTPGNRWNTSDRGSPCIGMTVEAGNAVFTGMNSMIELDRLHGCLSGARARTLQTKKERCGRH